MKKSKKSKAARTVKSDNLVGFVAAPVAPAEPAEPTPADQPERFTWQPGDLKPVDLPAQEPAASDETPTPAGIRARLADVAREDPTLYTLTGDLDPKRKGQIVKVAATLKSLGSATAAQVADKLVADGLYTCKPPAVVPVRTWLRQFVEQGIAQSSQAESRE